MLWAALCVGAAAVLSEVPVEAHVVEVPVDAHGVEVPAPKVVPVTQKGVMPVEAHGVEDAYTGASEPSGDWLASSNTGPEAAPGKAALVEARESQAAQDQYVLDARPLAHAHRAQGAVHGHPGHGHQGAHHAEPAAHAHGHHAEHKAPHGHAAHHAPEHKGDKVGHVAPHVQHTHVAAKLAAGAENEDAEPPRPEHHGGHHKPSLHNTIHAPRDDAARAREASRSLHAGLKAGHPREGRKQRRSHDEAWAEAEEAETVETRPEFDDVPFHPKAPRPMTPQEAHAFVEELEGPDWEDNNVWGEWAYKRVLYSSCFWTAVSWMNFMMVWTGTNLYRIPKRIWKKGLSIKYLSSLRASARAYREQVAEATAKLEAQRAAQRALEEPPEDAGSDTDVDDWVDDEAGSAASRSESCTSLASSDPSEQQ